MSLFYLKIGPEGIRIRTSAALVLVNKTYDEVLVERVAPEPEEYILGPDGEKIVAEPPVFRQAQEPEAPDSRSAEMVEALSGRTPEKNGLVEYIEKTAGGNGNGTPALRQEPEGETIVATRKSEPPSMGSMYQIREVSQEGLLYALRWYLAEEMRKTGRPLRPSEIAKRIGVYTQDVTNTLAGRKSIGRKTLGYWAKGFGTTVEEIIARAKQLAAAAVMGTEAMAQVWPKAEEKDQNDQKDQKAKEQAPAGGDGKSGNNEGAPVRNKRGSRQPKEEPEVLDPMVVAVCEACRENVGDVECGKCLITKGLQKARVQETPGQITHNVKLAVCAGCTHKAGEKCRTCRMGMYWAAVEYYNQGKGLAEAAREAESDYQAELAAKR